jgi:hypothetical protein
MIGFLSIFLVEFKLFRISAQTFAQTRRRSNAENIFLNGKSYHNRLFLKKVIELLFFSFYKLVPLKYTKSLRNKSQKVGYFYEFKSGRQCTFNETMWRVRVTTVGMER